MSRKVGFREFGARGDHDTTITRVFDAPRNLVFDALTRRELLKRWLSGPPGWSLVVCEIDLKVGGAYRYVWRGPGGTTMCIGGILCEIVRPERIVCTQRFDDDPMSDEAVATLVLTEHNGKTTLTNFVHFPARAARGALRRSAIEPGAAKSYGRFNKRLASTTARGDPLDGQ